MHLDSTNFQQKKVISCRKCFNWLRATHDEIDDTYIMQSSAECTKVESSQQQFWKFFLYKLNNNGSSTILCGNPLLTLIKFEKKPLMNYSLNAFFIKRFIKTS